MGMRAGAWQLARSARLCWLAGGLGKWNSLLVLVETADGSDAELQAVVGIERHTREGIEQSVGYWSPK